MPFIERVGFYNPCAGANSRCAFARSRDALASVGAQLSPTVARLVDKPRRRPEARRERVGCAPLPARDAAPDDVPALPADAVEVGRVLGLA